MTHSCAQGQREPVFESCHCELKVQGYLSRFMRLKLKSCSLSSPLGFVSIPLLWVCHYIGLWHRTLQEAGVAMDGLSSQWSSWVLGSLSHPSYQPHWVHSSSHRVEHFHCLRFIHLPWHILFSGSCDFFSLAFKSIYNSAKWSFWSWFPGELWPHTVQLSLAKEA